MQLHFPPNTRRDAFLRVRVTSTAGQNPAPSPMIEENKLVIQHLSEGDAIHLEEVCDSDENKFATICRYLRRHNQIKLKPVPSSWIVIVDDMSGLHGKVVKNVLFELEMWNRQLPAAQQGHVFSESTIFHINGEDSAPDATFLQPNALVGLNVNVCPLNVTPNVVFEVRASGKHSAPI
eukprot:TRINITY_DN6389_c0_g4_i2.p1 TRINITY_DN6389_c0_g4~~TRINITY_DN6389_c0_g4_i2.p1  ORF type:complete len:178 (-),score=20.57 TRINITY_DN6389_c0_g4_i2:479-1012(-)